jgi:lysozyme family protein
MATYFHIDQLIEEVIGREGGYSNHPADRGGATRWGITEAVARAHGYRGVSADLLDKAGF